MTPAPLDVMLKVVKAFRELRGVPYCIYKYILHLMLVIDEEADAYTGLIRRNTSISDSFKKIEHKG